MRPASQHKLASFRALLGNDPEVVLIALKGASDALSWIEEIFKTIADEADRPCNQIRLKQLAKLGAYVAGDIGNSTDCMHEQCADKLAEAGFDTYKRLESREA